MTTFSGPLTITNNQIREIEARVRRDKGLNWTQPCLVITVGLPASGKTTFAKAMAYRAAYQNEGPPIGVVNREEIHRELTFEYPDPSRDDEVTKIQESHIFRALNLGGIVIADDNHLDPSRIEAMRQIADDCDVPFYIIDDFMNVPFEECLKRDLNRARTVGKDVLEQLYYQYWSTRIRPLNIGWRSGIICDLDGTLSLLPPGLSFPEAYQRDYRQDLLNVPVRSAVESAQRDGFDVILLSGRPIARLEQTEDWLINHRIHYDRLLMRPAGDTRPDYVVKKDLYINHIMSKWHIRYVLDDRPSVVRMWRAELNLPVFQVAPNIEF